MALTVSVSYFFTTSTPAVFACESPRAANAFADAHRYAEHTIADWHALLSVFFDDRARAYLFTDCN